MIKAARYLLCLLLFACALSAGCDRWCRPCRPDADNLTERLQEHVYTLSETIGPRSMDRFDALEAAADYIAAEFDGLGLPPAFQAFSADGNIARNIIAEKKGVTSPGRIIIISAHYDTYESPGANDDASGIAVMLELARAMAEEQTSCTVRFIAFANEERPYFGTMEMGSMVYATEARHTGQDIAGVINLDMVGYYPHCRNYLIVGGNSDSQELALAVSEAFSEGTDLPIRLLAPDASGLPYADQWSFWKQRYVAVLVSSSSFFGDDTNHTEDDTYANLHYCNMAEIVRGLQAVVRRVAD